VISTNETLKNTVFPATLKLTFILSDETKNNH